MLPKPINKTMSENEIEYQEYDLMKDHSVNAKLFAEGPTRLFHGDICFECNNGGLGWGVNIRKNGRWSRVAIVPVKFVELAWQNGVHVYEFFAIWVDAFFWRVFSEGMEVGAEEQRGAIREALGIDSPAYHGIKGLVNNLDPMIIRFNELRNRNKITGPSE
jgi:hypothetical protein